MGDSTETTVRLPQGQAHTRTNVFEKNRDQEISNSVLDSIWNKTLSRRKPVAPDSFETYLRDRKEAALADIYHTLNEKPAASFDGLVWFAVSRLGLCSPTIKRSLRRLTLRKTRRIQHLAHCSRVQTSAVRRCLKLFTSSEQNMHKLHRIRFDYGMRLGRHDSLWLLNIQQLLNEECSRNQAALLVFPVIHTFRLFRATILGTNPARIPPMLV